MNEIVKTALVGAVTAPASLITGAAQGAYRRFTNLMTALNTPRTGQDSYTSNDLGGIQQQSLLLGIGYATVAVGLLGWAVVIGLPGGLGAGGIACLLASLALRQRLRWKLARKLMPAALLLSLILGGIPDAWADDGIMAALQTAAENDPATMWLSAIVGEGAGGTAFSALLGWSNSLALAIGGLLVAYNTYAGALQTAHEGQLLGRRWSSLWAPIRVPVAIAFLVPASAGGLSVWQEVVLTVAKYSIGAPNLALGNILDQVVDNATPIIDPPNPDARKLVAGLVENYACSLILHQVQVWETAGRNTSQPITINRRDEVGKITLSWDGSVASGLGPEACGAVIVATAPTTKGLATATRQAILSAHVRALDRATQGAAVIAQQIAAHVTADPHATSRPALPEVGELEHLANDYQNAVLSEVRGVIQGDKAFRGVRETVAAEIKASGWSGLGAMYARVAALNATILEATTEIPEVRQPSKALAAASSIVRTSVVPLDQSHWLVLSNWLREARRDPDRLRHDASQEEEGASAVLKFIDLGRAASAFDYMQLNNQGGTRGSVMQAAANIGHLVIPVGWVAFVGGVFHSTVGTVGLGLLVLGGWLAYWLPMVPYLAWLGAVMAWLLLVIEALVAGPTWCLAHLRMDGEGLSGGANTGWLVMLNMSLRPTILVTGFLVSIQMFELGGAFVGRTFIPAVSSMLGSHFGGISAFVAVLLLWMACLHLIANVSFGAITLLPDRIMRWIESQQSGVGEQQHVDRASHSAVAVMTGGHVGAVTGAMQSLGQKSADQNHNPDGDQKNDKFFDGTKTSASIQVSSNNNSTGQHQDGHGKFFR